MTRRYERRQDASGPPERSPAPSTVMVPAFLTAREVADMLRVDERTVLRWAQHDASMPATRLGRVVRFEREPLLRWLARKQPRTAGSLVGARGRGPPNVA